MYHSIFRLGERLFIAFLCIWMCANRTIAENWCAVLSCDFLFFIIETLVETKVDFVTLLLSHCSSSLLFFFCSFCLGAWDFKTWLKISLVLGQRCFFQVRSIAKSYSQILSVLGLIIGSFAFPLDWPVFWKEPPIPQIVCYAVASAAGAILDLAKRAF